MKLYWKLLNGRFRWSSLSRRWCSFGIEFSSGIYFLQRASGHLPRESSHCMNSVHSPPELYASPLYVLLPKASFPKNLVDLQRFASKNSHHKGFYLDGDVFKRVVFTPKEVTMCKLFDVAVFTWKDGYLLLEHSTDSLPPGAFTFSRFKGYHPIFNCERNRPVYKSCSQAVKMLSNVCKDCGFDDISSLILSEPLRTESKLKHAFVVVEGLDGTGKSTMTKNLANYLGAVKMSTPPDEIVGFRKRFDGLPELLHRSFYAYSNYLAASHVAQHNQVVVMDRYWHSTTAVAMAKEAGCGPLPPLSHPSYGWPSDLLAPTAVLLLTTAERERDDRVNKRDETTFEERLISRNDTLRRRILEAYRRIGYPKWLEVNTDGTEEESLELAVNALKGIGIKKMKNCGSNRCCLSNTDINRYSRQLLLPEIGVKGQCKLQEASVLVVGCGGLGCPAAQYLAAVGVGTVGMVDYDVVEESNLHRQVLHTQQNIGMRKVDSAIQSLESLNPRVRFRAHHLSLQSDNALDIIKQYDLVLDCTDNVATRYLLNDSCVLCMKPLVSGSALRFEGQLTVYNLNDGPCYRCLYPNPPPPESVTNCSDGGVIGAVTGVIGSMQALEAVKIMTSGTSSFSGVMLLFDGLRGSFRNVKLRQKQKTCNLCGVNPTITELQDYVQFCGALPTDKDKNISIIPAACRVDIKNFSRVRCENLPHLLVDVRTEVEYDICRLSPSINVPLNKILRNEDSEVIQSALASDTSVYFVCKRGNDSQRAVKYFVESGATNVKDVIGGLTSWSGNIDSTFPVY